MTETESAAIAARLANASQLFPLPHNDVEGRAVRDSVVYVESEGNVVTATVTDHDGHTREYRAEVRQVKLWVTHYYPEREPAPVDPVLPAPAGTVHTHQPLEESR